MEAPAPVACSAPGCSYTTPSGIPDHATATEHLRLHAQLAHTHPAATQLANIERPEVKQRMTQDDYSFFVSEWERYKRATGITEQVILDELWNTMPLHLKQQAFKLGKSKDLKTEELLLARIHQLVVQPTSAPNKPTRPRTKPPDGKDEEHQYDSFVYAAEENTYDSFQYEAPQPTEQDYEYENVEASKKQSEPLKILEQKSDESDKSEGTKSDTTSLHLEMVDSNKEGSARRKHKVNVSYVQKLCLSSPSAQSQAMEKVGWNHFLLFVDPLPAARCCWLLN